MSLRKNPAKLLNFFVKKKKEVLLTGSLLFISAVVSLEPAAANFINGFKSISPTIFTASDYVSMTIFSLLLMTPSLVLFCISYLLWEGHSLGRKLSIATSGIAVLIAIIDSAYMYVGFAIASLSFLAVMVDIQRAKDAEDKVKDSPIATEKVVKFGLRLSAIFCIGVVVAMVAFVVVMATPFLSVQLFTSMNLNLSNVQAICQGLPHGSAGGVLAYALGSLLVVTFCEFIAVPIGILAAIYLAEYSAQGRIVNGIRFFIEVLAGSPSIVIAIIGFTLFTVTLGWNYTLWGGAVALSFMALPWNIRVAEGAIRAVPRSYREASFALGASQWQTARQIMLYAAMPGIITGVLLGIGVAIGETLVLLFTYSGPAVNSFPTPWWHIFSLHTQLPSLTVFIWSAPGSEVVYWGGNNLPGGNQTNKEFFVWSLAFSAALVLVVIYLILCVGALLLRNYLNRRMKGS